MLCFSSQKKIKIKFGGVKDLSIAVHWPLMREPATKALARRTAQTCSVTKIMPAQRGEAGSSKALTRLKANKCRACADHDLPQLSKATGYKRIN